MRTVNIFKAKSDLSRLVEAVESGAETEIVIARNGRPAARLVPLKKIGRPAQRIGVIKVAGDIPPDDSKMTGIIADMFGLPKKPRAKKRNL
jgi:prevent-host-death family protein